MVTFGYQRYQVLHDSMLCMLCIVTSVVCRELESEKRYCACSVFERSKENEKELLSLF